MSADRSHLTEAQRAELTAIMADRPGLTDGQVAALFLARTGRKIRWCTVQRRRLYGPYKSRPGNRHLSEAERGLLRLLIEESEGAVGYAELARQFGAAAGRTISLTAVWRFAVDVLGLPKIGRGRGPKASTRHVARRIDHASAAKLERARVDRSPRVGKSGRVQL